MKNPYRNLTIVRLRIAMLLPMLLLMAFKFLILAVLLDKAFYPDQSGWQFLTLLTAAVAIAVTLFTDLATLYFTTSGWDAASHYSWLPLPHACANIILVGCYFTTQWIA